MFRYKKKESFNEQKLKQIKSMHNNSYCHIFDLVQVFANTQTNSFESRKRLRGNLGQSLLYFLHELIISNASDVDEEIVC